MNNRLEQFLQLEDLTPSKLAEILGIQRSGISHLLAGRNNPSYDFIQKMLVKFPNINPDWLILGKGKPYRSSSSVQLPSVEVKTAETARSIATDLFSSPTQIPEKADNDHQSLKDKTISAFSGADETKFSTEEIDDLPTGNEHVTLDNNDSYQHVSKMNLKSFPTANEISHSQQRKITRIMVFFDDGTFEER